MTISFRDTGYIANGNTSANITGAWIDTTAIESLAFQASIPASAGGSWGNLVVDGTNDPAKTLIQSCSFSLTTDGVGTPGLATSASFAGTTAQAFMLELPYSGYPLPQFVRLRYMWSSNGSANQLNVFAIGRL